MLKISVFIYEREITDHPQPGKIIGGPIGCSFDDPEVNFEQPSFREKQPELRLHFGNYDKIAEFEHRVASQGRGAAL